MTRVTAAALVLTLAAPAARADEKADAAKALNGSYELVSFLVGGKADDSMRDEFKAFVIKDGVITVTAGKREVVNFTVDPAKKPAHLDMTAKDGTDGVKGIYEAKDTEKGLELTIAFSKGPDAERPKDFKGEGERTTVVKLLRKKEK